MINFKTAFASLLIAICSGLFSNHIAAQQMSVMSYNIRYNNPKDAPNDWDSRKQALTDLVGDKAPDFLGLQEALIEQLSYVNKELGDTYSYIGVGRDDGKEKGEFSPLLYRNDQWKLIKGTTFWLSDTPHEISVGWDAAMERICSYGYFEHLDSGQRVWVFNTHFDHVGVQARKNSAQLILDKINTLNTSNEAVILMGDLNMTPEMEGIELISKSLTDPISLSHIALKGSLGTFSGFKTSGPFERRIDYIFSSKTKAISYEHLDQSYGDSKRFPSDHFAVWYTAALGEQ